MYIGVCTYVRRCVYVHTCMRVRACVDMYKHGGYGYEHEFMTCLYGMCYELSMNKYSLYQV